MGIFKFKNLLQHFDITNLFDISIRCSEKNFQSEILFYFIILFYFLLFYFILFYFILFYFIFLFHFILFYYNSFLTLIED